MIVWRNGKAGYANASNKFIRGMFSYQFSSTSVTIEPELWTVQTPSTDNWAVQTASTDIWAVQTPSVDPWTEV